MKKMYTKWTIEFHLITAPTGVLQAVDCRTP